MYRRNIAAAAAILFLASSTGFSAYAAPKETKEAQETEAVEREAGFIPIEEMEIESEAESEQINEEDQGDTENSQDTEKEEEKTEPIIQSPEVEKTFRFFQVDRQYALSRRDDVYFYEKMDTDSDKVGKIDTYGVLHILSEEEDGWCYVESGKVRGFVKERYLLTGEKAERYVERQDEECMDTAEALKEPDENEAFLYTQTTAYDVVVKKEYALAEKDIEILDRIPEEKNDSEEETAQDLRDSDDTSKQDQKEEPVVVGTLKEQGLCYILDDEDEVWYYVESDDVRGFVKADDLDTGMKIKKEVLKNGEDSYELADEKVKPEDNKACYYTITSVKEASVSGLIRTSMIKYAEQFLGNPYVWGGTSLTNGADCSGFVQSIYAEFGYSIPRVAEDQAMCATKIPVEDALPGDLIFYQRDNYIYHVVMSTGDGGTIEAQSSATGIVRSTVNYDNAAWAVRIISDEDTDILEHLKEKNLASEHYDETVIAKAADYGSYLGQFKLTAYCSCPICCGIWSGGPTASGVMPTSNHTVAMAGVPFGTELIINGQVYTVEDRGTPYGHVDIYMNGHQEALQFGVQYAEVYEKK